MAGIRRSTRIGVLTVGLIWQAEMSGQQAVEQHEHQAPAAPLPAQDKEKSEMQHMHHHGQIPTVKPVFPRLGKGQEQIVGTKYTLDQLERMALTGNPTLGEAEAEVRSAEGRRLQVGLYPNPRIGFEGEELRGGSYGGGEQGFYITQPLITGGKLRLNRRIVDQEIQIARQEAVAQRYRILNAVRTAYVHVLAAQEMVATDKDLVEIAKNTLKVAQQLHNIGQADDTEVLQAEIEDQQAEIGVITDENSLRRLWAGLLAVVANPELSMGGVTGSLDTELPELGEEQLLDPILKDSPAVKIAQANVARSEAAVSRARVETIPNLEFKGGLQQNSEAIGPTVGKVGLQGFAEIGVELHIFDRNQGSVQAARADVERARHELQRVSLSLRDRTSNIYRDYQNAKVVADRYVTEILPRARTAYGLMVQRYGLTLASYTQVLNLQRTLFRLETDYITALETLKTNAVILQGFLLSGGLDLPSATAGGDVPPMTMGLTPMMTVPMGAR
jgi:outer membrane protein, heavy metal efflux system